MLGVKAQSDFESRMHGEFQASGLQGWDDNRVRSKQSRKMQTKGLDSWTLPSPPPESFKKT